MTPAAPVCSDTSRSRDEPLVATASRVERWLLVEHPGPWGPESVPSSRMALHVARALAELAAAGSARLLLVRRHRDEEVGEQGRWVFAVDSRPGSEQVRAVHVDDDAELLELAPWRDPDGWDVVDKPLYLVCTHGRKDRCCAVRGRPVAHALSAARPGQVWESSHLGGDRFAPNLVALPEGLYVGRVEADEVVAVVEALEAGTLPAGLVRGRSSLPSPAQAAQHFARAASGRLDRDDLALVRQEVLEPDVWRVLLDGAPQVDVVVRYVRDGEARVISCGDPEKVPPSWALVSLT
ncbi:MAG: Sucraseferredoxin family protein [Frankiales bacterium]|nr:Sucraseferredoxin family protein [Frankiales bacterium]